MESKNRLMSIIEESIEEVNNMTDDEIEKFNQDYELMRLETMSQEDREYLGI